MTPFPEAEDMTVKRLYVALKRGDMQLLQMGAHKLHEKFHTGYKFSMLNDLKQILTFVEEKDIPNDIKDLLSRTINDILNNKPPTDGFSSTVKLDDTQEFKQEEPMPKEQSPSPVLFTPPVEEKEQPASDSFSHGSLSLFSEPKPKEQETVQEKETSSVKNVAVFYDDKAEFAEYSTNRIYRAQLELSALSKETLPQESIIKAKATADIVMEPVSKILKKLNEMGALSTFVTTSRSEGILKTFIENNINFNIPLVSGDNTANTSLVPLLGLSNLFICPKCGKREYFGGFHNSVLTLECKSCNSVMYPDIAETNKLNTTSAPYFWISGLKAMSKADTFVLINPPLEPSKMLISEFLKTAFELALPKKVYIMSKEAAKKDYYIQTFKEINEKCFIKSEFATEEILLEEFKTSQYVY